MQEDRNPKARVGVDEINAPRQDEFTEENLPPPDRRDEVAQDQQMDPVEGDVVDEED